MSEPILIVTNQGKDWANVSVKEFYADSLTKHLTDKNASFKKSNAPVSESIFDSSGTWTTFDGIRFQIKEVTDLMDLLSGWPLK